MVEGDDTRSDSSRWSSDDELILELALADAFSDLEALLPGKTAAQYELLALRVAALTSAVIDLPDSEKVYRRRTREEHRLFLKGPELYGRSEWKGISKKRVGTRTPAQIASHAQKYYRRLGLKKGERKRSNTAVIPDLNHGISRSQPINPRKP